MKKLGILIIGAGFLTSCNQDSGIFEKMYDFDQGPMLENIGENLIVPAYKTLTDRTAALEISVELLVESPTLENLEAARVDLKAARIAWQYCSPYLFGPAETNALSSSLNIYPINKNRIETNITEGSYDLSTLANSDAKGFQTLGYLLHVEDLSDEAVLSSLVASRALYLKEVVAEIASKSSQAYAAWSIEGGNYLGTFSSEDAFGVNAGSSVAKLVNALNITFEQQLRDGKLGIPVGLRSRGEVIPTSSEAYFSGYSVELIHVAIDAYFQLYLGGEGEGLDDYLLAIQATTIDNKNLSEKIGSQFQDVIAAASKLSEPYIEQLENEPLVAQTVFAEMQRLIVSLKVEMASSMGVVITYQDNDGD